LIEMQMKGLENRFVQHILLNADDAVGQLIQPGNCKPDAPPSNQHGDKENKNHGTKHGPKCG